MAKFFDRTDSLKNASYGIPSLTILDYDTGDITC